MTSERLATIVSSSTAILLVTIKLIIGIFSGSIAVLSSAIDSLLDFFVSVFNFVAIHNSQKPVDEKFNYGRGKIEALASLFEGIIITISGLYIIRESILKFIHKTPIESLNESISVMIISLIITFGLVIFLHIVAKKTKNLVIESDLLHYKTDIYSNVGIILALIIIHFTGYTQIDAIIGFIIGVYIIVSAFTLIKKGFFILLDGSLGDDVIAKIIEIIQQEKEVTGHHFLKTRVSGKRNFVDVHIVFNPHIKLIDAHKIGDRIEDDIQKIDQNVHWVCNIHLDPYDDSLLNR